MAGTGGMGGGRWAGSGSSFESPQIPGTPPGPFFLSLSLLASEGKFGSSLLNHDTADPFVVRETRPPPKPAPTRQGMVLGQKEPTSRFLQAMKKEEGVDLLREEAAAIPGAPPVAREKVKYVGTLLLPSNLKKLCF